MGNSKRTDISPLIAFNNIASHYELVQSALSIITEGNCRKIKFCAKCIYLNSPCNPQLQIDDRSELRRKLVLGALEFLKDSGFEEWEITELLL